MMLTIPDRETILDIQSREQAYYFSAAFDVVLRKHGWLAVLGSDSGRWNSESCFVSRQTPADRLPLAGLKGAAVIEGPLAPEAAEALGLRVEDRCCTGGRLASSPHSSDTLPALSSELHTHQIIVRRIPVPAEPGHSKPKPFVCEDPLWRRDGIRYQALHATGSWTPALTLEADHGRAETVAVTDGRRLVIGLPLLDLTTFQHTFPPLHDAGYYTMESLLPAWPIEQWLLASAERLIAAAGALVVRMDPWPRGSHAAFTLRHDYDRPISAERMNARLGLYARLGVKATWFWLERTTNADQARAAAASGHENALHTMTSSPEAFAGELRAVERSIGSRICGATAHGGRGSQGYLGHNQLRWALENGLVYGELLGQNNRLPHEAVVLKDGIPRPAPLMLPALHRSLDASMKPGDTFLDRLRSEIPAALESGSHVVLMNHPDIHDDAVEALIESLPLDGVWCATLEAVCRWARVTRAEPSIEIDQRRFRVQWRNPLPAEGRLCLLGRRSSTIDLPARAIGVEIDLNDRTATVTRARELEDYFEGVREAIVAAYRGEPAAVAATVAVNTTNLRDRAERIAALAHPQAGEFIAELGCGYGFLGMALHTITGARVDCYDLAEHYLEVGERFVERHPELREQMTLRQLDYASQQLPEDTYDVVVLNSTFHYVVGRDRQRYAVGNIFRSLRPGGRVYLYQANRWYPFEPFTHMFGVHWLPRRLGSYITTRRGKRSLMDQDIQSPLLLRRMFRAAGFTDLRYFPGGWETSSRNGRRPSLRKYLAKTYALTARRPS